MGTEKQRPESSITDRLKMAGEHLEVSRAELREELTRFATLSDVQGARKMFDAYLAWELREAPKKKKGITPDEIRGIAHRNFDYVAEVADNIRITKGDEGAAIELAHQEDMNVVGPVRRFYRDAVGYHPESPENELN
jgi:hypothetical protein